MMQNSSVAVVFTNEQNQQTIQARGIASVVANTEEANAAADVLRHTTGKSLDWTPPLSKINAGSYQLYKIAVNYARISIFGDKRAGETPTIIEYRV